LHTNKWKSDSLHATTEEKKKHNEAILERFIVLLAKQAKRLRCACDELVDKRVNVELRLASLRSRVENVVNVYGGFFGEIVTQLKMHRSSMTNIS
jgi:hypothetical protein